MGTAPKRQQKKSVPAKKKPPVGGYPPAENAAEVTALATVQDSAVYAMFDELDADIIVQELQGIVPAAARPLAYEFRGSDGNMVRGLSSVGIQEAVRQMARQREYLRPISSNIEPMEMPHYGACVLATVTVQRFVVDPSTGTEHPADSATGTKLQPLRPFKKDGIARYDDPFAIEKAMTKAERNGKAKLIRTDVASKVLALALKKNLVQQTNPQQAAAIEKQQQAQQQAQDRETAAKPDPLTDIKAWLEYMARVKTFVGDEQYYKTLDKFGAKHANQVMKPEQRGAIIKELQDVYRERQKNEAAAKASTAKAEGRPADSLFDGEPPEPGSNE